MKKYTQEQLDEILKKHKKWLDGEDGGERADLTNTDLTYADLTYADLDFSSFPLWCGSLKAQFDDRLIIQLLYHLLSIAKHSKNISAEIKQTLLCHDLICIANKFHRVSECGMIKREESECKNS
nr:MAG TPA: hypothetical protein [Caudoviricetes sp.]